MPQTTLAVGKLIIIIQISFRFSFLFAKPFLENQHFLNNFRDNPNINSESTDLHYAKLRTRMSVNVTNLRDFLDGTVKGMRKFLLVFFRCQEKSCSGENALKGFWKLDQKVPIKLAGTDVLRFWGPFLKLSRYWVHLSHNTHQNPHFRQQNNGYLCLIVFSIKFRIIALPYIKPLKMKCVPRLEWDRPLFET